MDDLLAEAILEACDYRREEDWKSVYLLGSLERRVTILSQQNRAFNLVQALYQKKEIGPGRKVIVVGAGIAGLAAAAAALIKGCQVMLLERAAGPLHLQEANDTRWVHPNVYNWPEQGWEAAQTVLPVLNWKAGFAGDVAKSILAEWDSLLNNDGYHGLLKLFCNVSNLKMENPQNQPVLRWNSDGTHVLRDVACVILAVGFGTESTDKTIQPTSYWRNDSYNQPFLRDSDRPKKTRCLVSGTGDGGLIDLLRLRLYRCRHDQMIESFFPKADPQVEPLLEALRDEQKEIRANTTPGKFDVTAHFGRLYEKHDEAIRELDIRIKNRLRQDTEVVLNSQESFPLSQTSSILNSFLAWRLLGLGVSYIPGKLKLEKNPAGYTITFLDGNSVVAENASNTDENSHASKNAEHFDQVIIRHGADTLNQIIKDFPFFHGKLNKDRVNLLPALVNMRKSPADMLWEPDDFLVEKRWILEGEDAERRLEEMKITENKLTQLSNPSPSHVNEPFRVTLSPDRWFVSPLQAVLMDQPGTPGLKFYVIHGQMGLGKTALMLRFIRALTDSGESDGFFVDFASTRNYPNHEWHTAIARRLERRKKSQTTPRDLYIVLDGLDASCRHRVTSKESPGFRLAEVLAISCMQKLLEVLDGHVPISEDDATDSLIFNDQPKTETPTVDMVVKIAQTLNEKLEKQKIRIVLVVTIDEFLFGGNKIASEFKKLSQRLQVMGSRLIPLALAEKTDAGPDPIIHWRTLPIFVDSLASRHGQLSVANANGQTHIQDPQDFINSLIHSPLGRLGERRHEYLRVAEEMKTLLNTLDDWQEKKAPQSAIVELLSQEVSWPWLEFLIAILKSGHPSQNNPPSASSKIYDTIVKLFKLLKSDNSPIDSFRQGFALSNLLSVLYKTGHTFSPGEVFERNNLKGAKFQGPTGGVFHFRYCDLRNSYFHAEPNDRFAFLDCDLRDARLSRRADADYPVHSYYLFGGHPPEDRKIARGSSCPIDSTLKSAIDNYKDSLNAFFRPLNHGK